MTGGPVFDHRGPGTPAEAWLPLVGGLPAGAEVGPHDHLAVVVAHPDDETLGAGGLIADASAAGAQITVVVATDGEASHPGSPTHDPVTLAALRRDEVTGAVRLLAPGARLSLLGLPDGGLASSSGLRRLVEQAAPDATVVATTWRDDGHPDHVACGHAAADLAEQIGARLIEFPIWGWHWGEPERSGPLLGPGWVTRRCSTRALTARAKALAGYRSQREPLSAAVGDEPVLGAEQLAVAAWPTEVFRASPAVDLPAGYFERLYAEDDDPWRTAERFYECRKRSLLLACLPRERFRRAFEPGCGTGLLTVELATRCDSLLAMDASRTAARRARAVVGPARNVQITVGVVPEDWPEGRFDLIVLSELGYYLTDPGELARRLRASLTPDGTLVACHWRHPAPGYPGSAAAVHASVGAGLTRVVQHIEEDFLLDVWSPDPRSVARREGLLGPDGDR